MEIIFLSQGDSSDIGSFSGVPYHMREALESVFDSVISFSVERDLQIDGDIEDIDLVLRSVGIGVTAFVDSHHADAIVCCGSGMIPYLSTSLPIILWHDSTWALLHTGALKNTFEFREFCDQAPDLYRWDQMALARADSILFTSEWAAEHTGRNYEIPKSKLDVAAYGPNLPGLKTKEGFRMAVSKRLDLAACQLTFIGSEWDRKGLLTAIELTEFLCGSGFKTQLNVIGRHRHTVSPQARPSVVSEGHLQFHGFVDKKSSVGISFIGDLLSRSHFLIHPALFDCSPIAISEASAYGVPTLASNVCGIPSLVRKDSNGRTFGLDDYVEKSAEYIRHYLGSAVDYTKLAESTFGEFESRLNWKQGAVKIRKTIQRFIS